MVIAAALSIQDPRERPVEHQQAADQKHARFADKESDFLSLLNLWNYLAEQQKELSANRFRKLCHADFLNYLRVREWQDLYSQLRQVAKGLQITPNKETAQPQAIHISLLAGLLSHIGMKDPETREFIGARNSRFAIFPGSALFRNTPRWVMAAELVETSRLWGRIAAKIEPEWVEPLAEHIVKRTYSEPRWSASRGAVLATERVTLFGLPIVVDRTVNYGRIDAEVSRELFIRHALVEGDWQTRHAFFRRNRELIGEVEELEHRARRRDILVDEDTLFAFYDQRIGPDVVSARHFDTWWKRTRATQPDLLTFDREQLINADAREFRPQDFPDSLQQNGLRLPLSYRFEPGQRDDGVTVRIPLEGLNQVGGDGLPWQVPGLRLELLTALIRSLPKPLRRNFVPVPDFAKAVLEKFDPTETPTLDAIAHELQRLTAVPIPRDAWQLEAVPEHLKATFRVVDDAGTTLAEGKDLTALKRQLRQELRAALSTVAHDIERTGLRDWDFDKLPRTVERSRPGLVVTAYPALVDDGDTVSIRLLDTEAEQRAQMWRGTRKLVLLSTPSPVKQLVRRLPNDAKLTLSNNPHGGVPALLDDCIACAADKLITDAGGPAWHREGFARLRDTVRSGLSDTAYEVITTTHRVLAAKQEVDTRIAGRTGPAVDDMRSQLNSLVYKGFITATGYRRLPDLIRYVSAIARRLEKLPERPDRDADWMRSVHELLREYQRLRDGRPPSPELRQIRWMIEELRVSYFAQTLGTPYPVSEKRIRRAMAELTK
jgi:ATP-dependent helicase HrpA